MMRKTKKKWLKPWHLGTHLRVLNESYPMSTNMTGFKNSCILVLWMKVTSALEGLSYPWFSSSTSYKVASQDYLGNIKNVMHTSGLLGYINIPCAVQVFVITMDVPFSFNLKKSIFEDSLICNLVGSIMSQNCKSIAWVLWSFIY